MRPCFTLRNALSFALALAGCIGTDTGNPIDMGDRGGEGTGGASLCRTVSTQTVALDAPTGLGVSANDVLAFAGGEHQETIEWRPASLLSYGPESGSQTLTVGLSPLVSTARYTDYEPATGGAELATDCPDALEIDAEMTLRSGQGALNERFSTVLSARSGESAFVSYVLDPKKLGGDFFASPTDPKGFTLTRLSVLVEFTRYGTSGRLQPTYESAASGENGAATDGNGALAAWGRAPCDGGTPVPLDASVAGFSAQSALTLLAEHATARARWHDGSETSLALSFAAETDGACAVVVPNRPIETESVGTLRVRGRLAVTSQDGHVMGEWPVVLIARPDAGGALAGIVLVIDNREQIPMGPLAEQYGIQGFDASSYDSFGLGVELTLTPTGSWSGTATVTGYTYPNCSSAPATDPNPPGGSSSPGCPGATPHQVAQLTLAP